MDLANKIKMAMKSQNITQKDLANILGVSQANISMKFASNNFKFSDYERLVKACGCELEVNIILPDGKII